MGKSHSKAVSRLISFVFGISIGTLIVFGYRGCDALFDYVACHSTSAEGRDVSSRAISITPEMAMNQIPFSQKIPVVSMVDTNGNFYLPLGSASDSNTNELRYVMLTRHIDAQSESSTLAISQKLYKYTDSGFEEAE